MGLFYIIQVVWFAYRRPSPRSDSLDSPDGWGSASPGIFLGLGVICPSMTVRSWREPAQAWFLVRVPATASSWRLTRLAGQLALGFAE
jgi:hypothetical protein